MGSNSYMLDPWAASRFVLFAEMVTFQDFPLQGGIFALGVQKSYGETFKLPTFTPKIAKN
jgi:hypothetical protein